MAETKVKIVYQLDKDTEMERLLVNDKYVGSGNVGDNHCKDRLDGLVRALEILGVDFELTKDYNWQYE